MKFLKGVLTVLVVLVAIVVLVYIWAGAGHVSRDEYENTKAYNQAFETSDTLKVMTYNVGWLSGMTNNLPVERPDSLYRENLSDIIQFLEREDPDIIGFQEIDFGSKRSYYYNQLDSIAYE